MTAAEIRRRARQHKQLVQPNQATTRAQRMGIQQSCSPRSLKTLPTTWSSPSLPLPPPSRFLSCSERRTPLPRASCCCHQLLSHQQSNHFHGEGWVYGSWPFRNCRPKLQHVLWRTCASVGGWIRGASKAVANCGGHDGVCEHCRQHQRVCEWGQVVGNERDNLCVLCSPWKGAPLC